jgi:general stress protein 26
MTSIDWDQMSAFIDGAGLAHVATASPSGEPHVALVFAVREGRHLTFTTRSMSGKARNLAANPRMTLMWQGNGAESYLWGTVRLIDDPQEKSRVWDGGLFPFDLSQFFGSPESPGWVVGRVDPERAVVMVQRDAGMERLVWRAR